MVFSSSLFMLLFLPASIILYYMMPSIKLKNAMLLLLSLVFYAVGEPVYILLLIAESFIGWLTALCIDRYGSGDHKKVRLVMILMIILLLAVLFTFKYAAFVISNLDRLFSTETRIPELPLPLGISFYTFQIIGYVADVYRKKIPAETGFFRFLLFISMFPQLVQGPILRYGDVREQMESRPFDLKQMVDGITRFIIGCAKKVILSGEIARTLEYVMENGITGKPVLLIWAGMICYALQLYFDFSGYSDMALGLGKMLGFEFAENFNYPYISRSCSEFWRRWHISLGAFFRDYVYIPLGGNRRHQLLNLLVVWALTGLWHGSSWNLIIWGLYFFVILAIEKFIFRGKLDRIPVINHLLTLFLLVIGWTIFYFSDFSEGLTVISTMLGMKGAPLWDEIHTTYFINSSAVYAVCILACLPIGRKVKKNMDILYAQTPDFWFIMTLVFDMALLYLCIAGIVGSGYNAFMYFNF